ncbi:MAG TPA: tetratricopeptide repeat protein [Candidatus Sulfotelmatobacter sp.]|nr:tetratricopeptide repeat protein [Candidatus Sulfotelmatobacter sp.]
MFSGSSAFLGTAILLAATAFSLAQTAKKPPAPSGKEIAERGASLAEGGRCSDAMPLLKKAIHQTLERELKKRVGLDGIHCAMTHDTPYDALEFLDVLGRDFPNDPEILYSETHAFSDLSVHASHELMREAPFSYQVHELNAETLEAQGKWDEAAAEYRRILEINPLVPGIHARLGRALLSKPQLTPEVIAEVKKNFEAELEIDPNNASAEYVLGDLAKNENDMAAAIRHFSRAAKLDTGFSDAYLAWGMALNSEKRFSEAIPPLETYESQAPDSPTGHFQLALAYAGVGRKADANREAALQRQTAETLEQVKRKVQEGLVQQSPSDGAQTPPPQ